MKDYKQQYYEQATTWYVNNFQRSAEIQRIEEVIRSIPTGAKTLLDVGCGKGVFVNELINNPSCKFSVVVGLDTSKEALKYVKVDKFCGTIATLPFKNESFDIVSCLELLEHLPSDDFKKGICELERISRKYLIVTVPNGQNLELALIACPKCRCRFNPYLHVRSFNRNTLRTLFASSTPLRIVEIGPIVHSLGPILHRTYRLFKNNNSYATICPQCGYRIKQYVQNRNASVHKDNILSHMTFLCRKTMKIMITSKKRKWLLALYRKNE